MSDTMLTIVKQLMHQVMIPSSSASNNDIDRARDMSRRLHEQFGGQWQVGDA